MNFKFQKIFTLILVNYGKKFNNSYSLTNVLGIKFQIINIVEIINSLINEKLLTARYIKGVGYFKLTKKGEEIILNNIKTIKEILVDEYPESSNFIEKLIQEVNSSSA